MNFGNDKTKTLIVFFRKILIFVPKNGLSKLLQGSKNAFYKLKTSKSQNSEHPAGRKQSQKNTELKGVTVKTPKSALLPVFWNFFQ